ncbi:Hypothetical protein NTJ_08403 [Nesidiocoris tenuis]|uniref:Transposase Tc1-like domain-containing protein n=1 Tax=Nesidiocoris tenuis TaxID=355587 RepID=A0ABN7ATR1_9HEMI|nr:Hypothetical protein NTJ_08403 [Nesidiocoris tenuis]
MRGSVWHAKLPRIGAHGGETIGRKIGDPTAMSMLELEMKSRSRTAKRRNITVPARKAGGRDPTTRSLSESTPQHVQWTDSTKNPNKDRRRIGEKAHKQIDEISRRTVRRKITKTWEKIRLKGEWPC